MFSVRRSLHISKAGVLALVLLGCFPFELRAQGRTTNPGSTRNAKGVTSPASGGEISGTTATTAPATTGSSANGSVGTSGATTKTNVVATTTPAVATTATDTVSGDTTAAPLDNQPRATEATSNSGRFEFGSYGRVNVASDLRGRTGRDADIVAHGSRVDDDSYAELELRREDTFADGIRTRIVTTLALLPPFFHFSGVANDKFAVRQLYAQGTYRDWTLWGGARMYRGDDIYLLNWWPLDNQNTIGGGVAKTFGDTSVALHGGMQRLDVPWQYQQIPSPTPYAIGAKPVTVLDRPRTIETAKVTHLVRGLSRPSAPDGLKFALYAEAHQLAAGVSRDVALQSETPLHRDSGWLIGTQVVYFTGAHDTYASLVFRHARGLAVYDPLSYPNSLANDKTASGAAETLLALSGNFEDGPFSLQWAGYLRFLRGATEAQTSLDRYDEGIAIVRPNVYLGDHFGVAVEGSYQARRYALIDPTTEGPLSASMVRGALLPYFSPAGRGSFARPRIGLVYAVSARDDAARSLYSRDDPFSWRSSEHYFGLAVEWWFNMSSYP